MKKKKKRQEQPAQILLEYLTGVYVGFMLLVFPLVFHNAYFDIFATKRRVYLTVTGIFLIVAALLVLVLLLRRSLRLNEKIPKEIIIFCLLEFFLFLFSLLLVDNPTEMFWGERGRRLGVLVMCMCVLTLLIIAAYGQWTTSLLWSFLIGAFGVYFFQITDEWQMNLLGMHLENVQDSAFISTIGNVNFNSAFNCLTLPVGMALYMTCKDKISRWVYGIFCLVGFAATICCRSDSGIIGFVVAFLVLFFVQKGDRESNIRFANLFAIWCGASALIAVCYSVGRQSAYGIVGAMGLLIQWKFILIEAVCAVVWHVLLWRLGNGEKLWKRLHKAVAIGILCIVAVVVILLIVVNAGGVDMTKYPNISKYVVFNDRWGSARGFIWKETWKQYLQFDIKKLLFGCGLTNYKTTAIIESAEVGLAAGATIDAHCEFLQMLFTTGIVGVIGYFGISLSVLVRCIRAYRRNCPEALAGVLAVSTYLAQGMFNNPQIATTPLLFVMLGIFCAMLREKKQEERK